MQDELPEGEEEEEEEEEDDDDDEEEEEEEEEERYGSKPAKRPRSDFVIEEAGQFAVNINCLHIMHYNVYHQHKTLAGENFGGFGSLFPIRQCFIRQKVVKSPELRY